MDWIEFAKELSNEGFFDLTNEPQISVSSEEINSYTGVCSYAEIQKALQVQNKEEQLEKIWSFFGGDRQEAYYQKRVLSYSFLKHVENVRFPKPQYGDKQRNFALGRAFEDLLTNKLDWQSYPNLTKIDIEHVATWVQTAEKNEYLQAILLGGENNKPHLQQKEFEGAINGFKFKCKVDFVGFLLDTEIVTDLKSTSATTENAFTKACEDFDYWVQAVIYLLLSKAQRHYIVGVSKKTDKVFVMSSNLSGLRLAQTKLEKLLENLTYYGIADYFKA